MPIFAHPPRIVPFFGYRNEDHLILEARALRAAPPRWDHTRSISKIRALLGHFASKEQPRLPVTLVIRSPGGVHARHEGMTNDEGFVRFDVPLDGWDLPATTTWEIVELHWINRDGPQRIEGFILTPGRDTGLAIISDIDDTIIETGITGGLRSVVRNWKRLLAQMPEDRVQVPGAELLYRTLSGEQPPDGPGEKLPATKRPFFYVSSSPWNLFSYLVAFMEARGLPIGPIQLRNWGFNRATLGSSGHGAHKIAAINSLLAFYPNLRFALIGDDTQGDLLAFAKVAEHNPQRIASILIRKAGERHSPEEIAAAQRIANAGVPLWTGEKYDVGQDFLARLGLDHDGETERIVAAIEQPTSAAPAD